METIKNLFQNADWKKEKHIPVIYAPSKAKKGDNIRIEVSVGKEIPHPNTTEHHIASIEIYFLPQKGKFPYVLAKIDFSAHGSSTEGPNTSGVYTLPSATINFKTESSGTIYAVSYCNIHGLWKNSFDIVVE